VLQCLPDRPLEALPRLGDERSILLVFALTGHFGGAVRVTRRPMLTVSVRSLTMPVAVHAQGRYRPHRGAERAEMPATEVAGYSTEMIVFISPARIMPVQYREPSLFTTSTAA